MPRTEMGLAMIYQIAFLNSAGKPSLHVTCSFACALDASRYALNIMARSHGPALVAAELGSDERQELVYLRRKAAITQIPAA